MTEALRAHHAAHPLLPGMDVAEARAALAELATTRDHELADAVLARLAEGGVIVRDAGLVRLPTHRPSTSGREDASRLIEAVASAEPTPPAVRDLVQQGFGAELIRAVCANGDLVRASADLVFTRGFVDRAEAILRTHASSGGITVSEFRERLGTTRKYALPLLEYFDGRGVTRRAGEVRVLRG
jgi:selenocysteine-specific elongation factor